MVECCSGFCGMWQRSGDSAEVEKKEAGVKILLRREGALGSWGVD